MMKEDKAVIKSGASATANETRSSNSASSKVASVVDGCMMGLPHNRVTFWMDEFVK